jgi:hypothetical protein
MKKILVLVLLGIALVTLAGCTSDSKVTVGEADKVIQLDLPGPNPELDKPAENEHVAGVLTGLWHGLISPVTLILSFFKPEIQMYEVHNNGSLYNFGFLIGAILVIALLGVSRGRRH